MPRAGLIAGGPKCETELDTLKMIAGALEGGAAGVVMGRNIWQSPCPEALLAAAHGLIHGGLEVKEAFELYTEAKEQKRSQF